MNGALEGIRVIDLTHYIAGPFCSMLLADMGAEVIKIEKAGTGDPSRYFPPKHDGYSFYFSHHNKNKKSVTIDFRSDEGQKILQNLISKADVLIENYRPGTLEKMGLTEEKLKELNPNLVLTSISGFGQTGPYKDRAAFDPILQAMSGLMSITGTEESGPMICGTFIADYLAGVYAAFGTVSALYRRKAFDDGGQTVDISLLDCLVSIMYGGLGLYHKSGELLKPTGNVDKILYPANAYKAKDGYLYIHSGPDAMFKRMCGAMGKPELFEQEGFSSAEWRLKNSDRVDKIINEWISNKSVDEVESLLNEVGIPVGPVNDMSQVFNNPQIKERKDYVLMDYPGHGEVCIPGVAIKMSKTQGEVYMRPPVLGEHNEEIYTELLNYSSEKIEQLKKDGFI